MSDKTSGTNKNGTIRNSESTFSFNPNAPEFIPQKLDKLQYMPLYVKGHAATNNKNNTNKWNVIVKNSCKEENNNKKLESVVNNNNNLAVNERVFEHYVNNVPKASHRKYKKGANTKHKIYYNQYDDDADDKKKDVCQIQKNNDDSIDLHIEKHLNTNSNIIEDNTAKTPTKVVKIDKTYRHTKSNLKEHMENSYKINKSETDQVLTNLSNEHGNTAGKSHDLDTKSRKATYHDLPSYNSNRYYSNTKMLSTNNTNVNKKNDNVVKVIKIQQNNLIDPQAKEEMLKKTLSSKSTYANTVKLSLLSNTFKSEIVQKQQDNHQGTDKEKKLEDVSKKQEINIAHINMGNAKKDDAVQDKKQNLNAVENGKVSRKNDSDDVLSTKLDKPTADTRAYILKHNKGERDKHEKNNYHREKRDRSKFSKDKIDENSKEYDVTKDANKINKQHEKDKQSVEPDLHAIDYENATEQQQVNFGNRKTLFHLNDKFYEAQKDGKKIADDKSISDEKKKAVEKKEENYDGRSSNSNINLKKEGDKLKLVNNTRGYSNKKKINEIEPKTVELRANNKLTNLTSTNLNEIETASPSRVPKKTTYASAISASIKKSAIKQDATKESTNTQNAHRSAVHSHSDKATIKDKSGNVGVNELSKLNINGMHENSQQLKDKLKNKIDEPTSTRDNLVDVDNQKNESKLELELLNQAKDSNKVAPKVDINYQKQNISVSPLPINKQNFKEYDVTEMYKQRDTVDGKITISDNQLPMWFLKGHKTIKQEQSNTNNNENTGNKVDEVTKSIDALFNMAKMQQQTQSTTTNKFKFPVMVMKKNADINSEQNWSRTKTPKFESATNEVREKNANSNAVDSQQLNNTTVVTPLTMNNKIKKLRALLNKMTPTTCDAIYKSILDIGITSIDEAREFLRLIFDKANTNHTYINIYADLCSRLGLYLVDQKIFVSNKNTQGVKFKNFLLSLCEEAFNKCTLKPFEAAPNANEEEVFEALLQYKNIMKGNLMFICLLAQTKRVSITVLAVICEGILKAKEHTQLEALSASLNECYKTFYENKKKLVYFTDEFLPKLELVAKDETIPLRVRFLLEDAIKAVKITMGNKTDLEAKQANSGNTNGNSKISINNFLSHITSQS